MSIESELNNFEAWWRKHQQWSWERGRDVGMPEKAPENWEKSFKHQYAAGWLARAERANPQLIDAAPELLEALKALHERYVTAIGNEGIEAVNARAAIEKATK